MLAALALAVFGQPASAQLDVRVQPRAEHAGRLVASPRLASLASWLAGRPLRVICATSERAWERLSKRLGVREQAWGVARLDGSRIWLAPDACAAFVEAAGVAFPLQAEETMFVLAHEVAHTLGVEGETAADCFAVAWAATLARRAGLDGRAARSAALALHGAAPLRYRRVACHPSLWEGALP